MIPRTLLSVVCHMVAARARRGDKNDPGSGRCLSQSQWGRGLPALPTCRKFDSAADAFLVMLVSRPGGSVSWPQAPLACLGQALWPWPFLAEASLCSQCAGHTFMFSLIGLAGLPFCPLGIMSVVISREGLTSGYFPFIVAGSQLSSRLRSC